MPVLDGVFLEEVDGGIRVVYDLAFAAIDTLATYDTAWLFQVVVGDLGGSQRRFGVRVYADPALGEKGFVWDSASGTQANYAPEFITFEGDLITAWYPDSSLSRRDPDVPITAVVSSGAHDVEIDVPVMLS